ncbi:hypothetical protein BSF42_33270 [Flavobacterium sp. ACN6]|nr:hypothetical protein BSF42_33270 [Flavobacterium sp. ACN6]
MRILAKAYYYKILSNTLVKTWGYLFLIFVELLVEISLFGRNDKVDGKQQRLTLAKGKKNTLNSTIILKHSLWFQPEECKD